MRAVRATSYGPPSGLVVEDVPAPVPGPGEVVVDIRASSVNFPDGLIVADRYQVSAPLPFTPGSEFAGVVSAVGHDVMGLEPGASVRGSVFVGAFAEQLGVAEHSVRRLPAAVGFRDAAAFGVTYSTAYHALVSVGRLERDEWVLVLGAAGGVGLAAVELAHHLGGRVVAAASSADKLAVCRASGADEVIDYTAEDLKQRTKDLTGGGASVVIDPVGGQWSEQALRATRFGARFVCVGFASGEIPRIPLNLVLLKGAEIKAFEYRTFGTHAPEVMAAADERLWGMLADGLLHPHIGAVHTLASAAEALDEVMGRRSIGKVLIEPTPDRQHSR